MAQVFLQPALRQSGSSSTEPPGGGAKVAVQPLPVNLPAASPRWLAPLDGTGGGGGGGSTCGAAGGAGE